MESNEDLQSLIFYHLNAAEFNDREIVSEAAFLFVFFKDSFICEVGSETFYKLPYKDISELIFDHEIDGIHNNSFQGFVTTVADEIREEYWYLPNIQHILDCYEKFSMHITLVLVQKKFMLKTAKNAEKMANDAKGIAKQASNTSTVAKNTAQEADKISKNAEQIAKKAEDVFDNSLVNYITILGIFASIIITVFGGISLTNATVQLLKSEFDLPVLVFVISLLLISFLCVLIVLITWVSSLKKSTEYTSAVKWWVLLGAFVFAIVSGLYLNKKIHTNVECYHIGYYTCMHSEILGKNLSETDSTTDK